MQPAAGRGHSYKLSAWHRCPSGPMCRYRRVYTLVTRRSQGWTSTKSSIKLFTHKKLLASLCSSLDAKSFAGCTCLLGSSYWLTKGPSSGQQAFHVDFRRDFLRDFCMDFHRDFHRDLHMDLEVLVKQDDLILSSRRGLDGRVRTWSNS